LKNRNERSKEYFLASQASTMQYKQERQFGFIFTTVFLIVAFWPLRPWGPGWPHEAPRTGWLIAAGVVLLVALVMPRLLAHPYRGWMAFGHVLGLINSKIIMGLIFFVVVTPIALLMKLFGKDMMHRRLGRSQEYWVKRGEPLTPESMRNQF
jgi:hypothetical protein